eukprot:CAMPEP_0195507752 /NCGR_PEP_ID=MMETSP0794_2-20130614/1139_1 /TAXON_ID=515487 /ORGANISM="Stephanopyxis turris, Strain CCMP 815" /LENGTH=237 /DNA_ID=CAMNT_0040634537 /DNA_START=58 /DNA_END=771 /DNA_ORIENTATION=-
MAAFALSVKTSPQQQIYYDVGWTRTIQTYPTFASRTSNDFSCSSPPTKLQSLPDMHDTPSLHAYSTLVLREEASLESASSTFGPVLPETNTLISMALVVILCVVTTSVWANEVVPVSRAKLAKSKNSGKVREYLDGLKEVGSDDDSMVMASEGESARSTAVDRYVGASPNDSRSFEKWLFSDWLNDNKSEKKAAALPFLKKAKWNSGDNPVLVASGLIMVSVLIASLTERVSAVVSG